MSFINFLPSLMGRLTARPLLTWLGMKCLSCWHRAVHAVGQYLPKVSCIVEWGVLLDRILYAFSFFPSVWLWPIVCRECQFWAVCPKFSVGRCPSLVLFHCWGTKVSFVLPFLHSNLHCSLNFWCWYVVASLVSGLEPLTSFMANSERKGHCGERFVGRLRRVDASTESPDIGASIGGI